jgi:hypothetical protein
MAGAATRSTRILTAIATLLLVVSVAFGLFTLVGLIAGIGLNGHEVGVHAQVSGTQLTNLPSGSVQPDHLDVLVRVKHATRSQLGWAAGRDLVPGVVLVAALWLVRSLLRSVRDRDPFTESNVRRLRTLALVVLIGVPVAIFVSSIFASTLAHSARLHSSGTEITMPGPALLGGLALFVLAEIFAAGVRMRDDLEGTV